MNKLHADKQNKSEDEGYYGASTTPMIWSIAIHLFVFVAGSITFAFTKHDDEVMTPPPIQIEFVDLADATNVPPKKEDTPKPKEEKKAPEPPKTKEPPKALTPPTSKPETAEPEPVLLPEKVEEKKPEPKPEVKKKPKPPETKPKQTAKDVIKKAQEEKKEEQSEDFMSVLKNLAGSETPAELSKEEETSEETEAEFPQAVLTRADSALTMSEQDALRQQLAQCWSVVPGARNAEDLVVEVTLNMNPDATVQSAKIVDTWRYSNDGFFRAAADSAMRAVRNPLCSPLKLPLNKYDQWKKITITFDPKDMF